VTETGEQKITYNSVDCITRYLGWKATQGLILRRRKSHKGINSDFGGGSDDFLDFPFWIACYVAFAPVFFVAMYT